MSAAVKNELVRHDGRAWNQMRAVRCLWNQYSYAPGAVIIELGNTKVLCAVTIQQGVPSFLRGKGTGWLSAEYALLPTATPIRSSRDNSACKRNGRAVEISRLIGRALRTIIDLSVIGERTIYIDCDVLQADGGTRVTAITGASLALQKAQDRWLADGIINTPFLTDMVMAVAVGVLKGAVVLDPDFYEDSSIDADFNVVATLSGKMIELQGGAEKEPLSWEQFDQIRTTALIGIAHLTKLLEIQAPIEKTVIKPAQQQKKESPQNKNEQQNSRRNSIFSLELRAKETV